MKLKIRIPYQRSSNTFRILLLAIKCAGLKYSGKKSYTSFQYLARVRLEHIPGGEGMTVSLPSSLWHSKSLESQI